MKKYVYNGETYYVKRIRPNVYNDLDGDIYELYDKNKKMIGTFSGMWEIEYYLDNGRLP